MSYKTLIYEKIDGVAKITLNRPERLNAINREVRMELYQLLEEIKNDPDIRAVIITGAPSIREKEGRREIRYSFSVGWDMTEAFQPSPGPEPPVDIMDYIANYEKPLIAMVNGYALGGGCELALACDFIFASENSQFGQPEIQRGFIPGWGATQRLPRRIGLSQAKRLIFTGDMIDGKEAERIGLADVVVPMEKLEEVTLAFARKLAGQAPLAIKYAKEVMNKGIEMDIAGGLKLEKEAGAKLRLTEDFREGIRAFMEKRQPVWKGK
ncbi:MAG: enoyl-CoA hydratase/isomerase family protein [Candidatus Bathyarchaeia archaeon]